MPMAVCSQASQACMHLCRPLVGKPVSEDTADPEQVNLRVPLSCGIIRETRDRGETNRKDFTTLDQS